MQTKLHLIANEVGQYKGISGGYSGAGFSGMKFNAIATQDQAGFDAWVAKVKASSKALNTMDEFNALAKKSENHPVEYFASADPKLFVNIINKFMGDMKHGEHAAMQHGEKQAAMSHDESMSHEGMEHDASMNHAGMEHGDAMHHEAQGEQMDHAGHMPADKTVKAGTN